MKYGLIVLLFTTLIYAGCTGKQSEQQALSFNSMFDKDSVKAYLKEVPVNFIDSSKKLFLKAIDLYKNKQKAEASVQLFIQAVGLYPSAGGYYELGNALLETPNADNNAEYALQAFTMAELMDYKPWSHVLFKKACAAASTGQRQETYNYLTYAVQNGFVDREKIISNKHLLKIGSISELLSAYNEGMAGNGDADAILWEGYSKQFGQASFPFMIDSGTLAAIGTPVDISYDYEKYVPEMRDYKFSRDVGREFFYFTKIDDNKIFKTIIYGSKSYDEERLDPTAYIIASFSNTGRLIDKKTIAGSVALDSAFKECSFISSKEFEVKEYKNIYEKDTEKEGYDDNKIIRRDLLATYKYAIDSTGKFSVQASPSL